MTKISNYGPPGSAGLVFPTTPGSTIMASVLTTEGDMLYQHSGVPTRLPIGSNAYLLTSNGTDPYWAASAALADPTTTEGDLIYRHTGALARLPIGSNTYVLTSNGTDPAWTAPGGSTSPLTTKGDIFTYTTTNARLPVGSDTYILAADSTQATGLKWEPAPSGTSPLTTKGDLWGFSTVDARVPVGSNTYVLTADSTQTLGVKWAAGGGSATDVVNVASGAGSVTIPGLKGSPDAVPGSPSASDDEFTAFSGWTAYGTLDTSNVTDFSSHWHGKRALTAGIQTCGIYKAIPAGGMPFTVTACIRAGLVDVDNQGVGILLAESSPGKGSSFHLIHNGASNETFALYKFTAPTTFSASVNANNINGPVLIPNIFPLYLRLIVTASNNVTFEYSMDGLLWKSAGAGLTNVDSGLTVANVGLCLTSAVGSQTVESIVDWIRFT